MRKLKNLVLSCLLVFAACAAPETATNETTATTTEAITAEATTTEATTTEAITAEATTTEATTTAITATNEKEEGVLSMKSLPLPKENKFIYFLTENANSMFKQQEDIELTDATEIGNTVVSIDEKQTFQPVYGFGASFTDSAAYLINRKLAPETRESLMKALFSPTDGIGISFTRQPMGASDFARDFYSYDDMPEGETDPELKNFSIDHDREDVIPLLKEAKVLNPDLLCMSSPWSPPGWMKTSGNMIGGELLEEYYKAYADYFVKYIQEYEKEGIDIFAVTPQNEPLYVPKHYPGCGMGGMAQSDFIRTALGPAFRENNIDAKIICYDHNWDVTGFAEKVLEIDRGNGDNYVAGVAWHVYGGNPTAQTKVLNKYPNSEVYFTEASGGEWVPPFEAAFMGAMKTGIDVLNNSARCVVLWNMALDENNGPVVPGFGRSTCRGIVKVNSKTGEVIYNLDYYVLAHFSRYIRPNAKRVAVEVSDNPKVTATACLNEDGTLAVVIANDGAKTDISVKIAGKTANITVPAKSAATLAIKL